MYLDDQQWVDRIKGKVLLNVERDTDDYEMELEFEDGIILCISIGAQCCDSAWLEFEIKEQIAVTEPKHVASGLVAKVVSPP